MEKKMEDKQIHNKGGKGISMLRTEDRNPRDWLRRTVSIAAVSAAALFVGGCATPSMMGGAPGVVTAGQQQETGTVFEGKITNLQPVTVKDVNPASGYGYGYIVSGAGALLGAEAGATAAQKAKNYIVKDVAESVGGIAGALIGLVAQQRVNTAPGCEITVEVNSNTQSTTANDASVQQSNKLVAIAQQAKDHCKSFSNGEKVNIDVLGGKARVVPAATQ